MATFESSLKSKLIYVFAISDERHSVMALTCSTTMMHCKKLPTNAFVNIPRRQV